MTDPNDIPSAGNGLYDRRYFLKRGGLAAAGLLTASAASDGVGGSEESIPRDPWMNQPGEGMSTSGSPSAYETKLNRVGIGSQPGTVGSGASRTPLEHLSGIITPSRLHFERHHSGIPDINPDEHSLVIGGLVKQPLKFDVATLDRYPQVSRIQFLECSGNSGTMISPQPGKMTCSELHGLVSCSEWGGVPLRVLLEEAGVDARAQWVIAEGADAAVMARSIPLTKILDDAIVALFQNGERLRPSNGYPMRLFLPGWEGNASVKWLRALKLTETPAMTKDETSKYSDLGSDGHAELFTFPMGVKSVITSPSPELRLHGKGMYQISGIAWSGAGKISRVEVSADGGQSWAEAALDEHVLPKALTRFRTPWDWQGQPATLVSRAYDERGAVQPTREDVLRARSRGNFYHVNAQQAWSIATSGVAENVYL